LDNAGTKKSGCPSFSKKIIGARGSTLPLSITGPTTACRNYLRGNEGRVCLAATAPPAIVDPVSVSDWMNYLKRKYAHGHWVLVVDPVNLLSIRSVIRARFRR